MNYLDKELLIRPIIESDFLELWKMTYGEELPEWKKWDAPYFENKHMTFEDYMNKKEGMLGDDSRWIIELDGSIIGTVGYYWEHKPSNWLEMGITIFQPTFWDGGYGTRALRLWINHLFNTLPLVRVGYTTWSGNERMIRLGEKLGMTMEARLRKCRYYNGEYYDSIRMGLLREEGENNPLFEMNFSS